MDQPTNRTIKGYQLLNLIGEGVYLVMRLIKGGSLEEIIQNGPLPLAQVTRILEQVASALTAAHMKIQSPSSSTAALSRTREC